MAETMLARSSRFSRLRSVPLVLLAGVFAFPFYFLITVSLKTTLQAFAEPFSFPVNPNWESYTTVLTGGGVGVNMAVAVVNSVLLTGLSCVFLIVIGSATAYTLARNPGWVSSSLFVFFVIGIIVPSQLGIAPLYGAMRSIGLVGNLFGMVLIYCFKQIPLTVFLYTGFFRALPVDYEEAAIIDGANRFQVFTRVVMPQMNAVTGTALVLNSLYIWNDLFDQLVFLSGSDSLTLPVAIYTLTFTNVSRWNIIFAAVVISLVPMVLLYLFMQRKVMASFGGGLKG